MATSSVWIMPRVDAPGLDEAFLRRDQWAAIPARSLVRAGDGGATRQQTQVRLAWSARGLHIFFACADPHPLTGEITGWTPDAVEEAVGVFLDPTGDRDEYMALFISPTGQLRDARVENPRHHGPEVEIDDTWHCPGIRVRCWSDRREWTAELLIPFSGITPALEPPAPGDRWTGNFYRITHRPEEDISAWRPPCTSPPDLHNTDRFGILEYGSA